MTVVAALSPLDRALTKPPKSLTDAELLILFNRWQRDRDPRARARLVDRYIPLARSLARRYITLNEPLDDLIGVANLALVKAIDRFDANRDVSFSSFAVPTILGELRRYFRDTGWGAHVPRGAQEAAMRVERAIKDMNDGACRGREISLQVIAEYLEWSVEDVVSALEASAAHFNASLDAPTVDSDGETVTMLSRIGAIDANFEMVDARLTITGAIAALPLNLRKIVEMRFAEDLTQQQIADRLGVSQMQISRQLRTALERVRDITASPA